MQLVRQGWTSTLMFSQMLQIQGCFVDGPIRSYAPCPHNMNVSITNLPTNSIANSTTPSNLQSGSWKCKPKLPALASQPVLCKRIDLASACGFIELATKANGQADASATSSTAAAATAATAPATAPRCCSAAQGHSTWSFLLKGSSAL